MVLPPFWTTTTEYLLSLLICPGSGFFEKLLIWKDASDDIIYILKALCGSRGKLKVLRGRRIT